jgi:cell division septation protein DedD
MADDVTEDQGPTVAELAERQDRTEGKLDQILEALKGTAGALHKPAQQATEARLDAPGNVAAEVQAELDRRDKATRAADTEAKVGTLSETVAKLAEKTPEAPVRRVTRWMYGGS